MKTIIMTAILIGIITLAGCINSPVQDTPIGGETDEHGCIGAAGYQWCPSQQKCMRMWEEYCEEYKDQYKGNQVDGGKNPVATDPSQITSFQECIDAGYPAMESHPRQCKAGDNTFIEETEKPTTS